jgi:hypothetical protein
MSRHFLAKTKCILNKMKTQKKIGSSKKEIESRINKMKVCRFYSQGNCHFGLRCRDSHEKQRNGIARRTKISTRNKNSEIENTFRETQLSFKELSIKAWTPQKDQYSYLHHIPQSEDFSVCIQSQGQAELFIRNDLHCSREPDTDRFEFLFRKQLDSSYLILDNRDCGRVVGYDEENSTIMTVCPHDHRSVSWVVKQIGSKVIIRHACWNNYWCVETFERGSSKLVLKKDLKSEFSLIKRLIPLYQAKSVLRKKSVSFL